jgi:hypothetical protein
MALPDKSIPEEEDPLKKKLDPKSRYKNKLESANLNALSTKGKMSQAMKNVLLRKLTPHQTHKAHVAHKAHAAHVQHVKNTGGRSTNFQKK